MPLSLFPARAPIGRATNADGSSADVLMTPEFARALADLLTRVGGPSGMSITAIMKELARRPSTLAQSAVPVSLTASLDEAVLATIMVPANAMGKDGALRISTTWSVSNNANNKTVIVRFGGSEISSNAVTTVSTYMEQRAIQNRGDTGSQVFVHGGFGFTGAPIGTLDKDTTLQQKIEIVAQLTDAGDVMTLEAYTVELIPTT